MIPIPAYSETETDLIIQPLTPDPPERLDPRYGVVPLHTLHRLIALIETWQ